MSKDVKNKGQIPRRDFLKDAGLLAGGIGTAALLNACATKTSTETITNTVTKTLPASTIATTITQTTTPPPAAATTTEAPPALAGLFPKGPAYWQYPLQRGKYADRFASGPLPNGTGDQGALIVMDPSIVPNGFFWLLAQEPTAMSGLITHNPHTHPYPEFLGWFSTDAPGADKYDLGCTITIYLGEEMEMHSFSKPTILFIPANLPHCPMIHRDMTRPILFCYGFPLGQKGEEVEHRELLEKVPEADRPKNWVTPAE